RAPGNRRRCDWCCACRSSPSSDHRSRLRSRPYPASSSTQAHRRCCITSSSPPCRTPHRSFSAPLVKLGPLPLRDPLLTACLADPLVDPIKQTVNALADDRYVPGRHQLAPQPRRLALRLVQHLACSPYTFFQLQLGSFHQHASRSTSAASRRWPCA